MNVCIRHRTHGRKQKAIMYKVTKNNIKGGHIAPYSAPFSIYPNNISIDKYLYQWVIYKIHCD